ncbi:MAG TPA: MoaD/ThiS family protein [Gemmatimonadales bacterium]|nr:MoaD/ThiS family protein [Gemmatimonadales bacterium]
MTSDVSVRVLFFARYAELMGREAVDLMVPAGATVAEVLERVRATLPEAGRLPPRPVCALNLRHVKLDARVAAGDEVALLPPVAGG